jgi:hypothetical protein
MFCKNARPVHDENPEGTMKKATLVFFLFCIAVFDDTFSQGKDHLFKCVPSKFTLNDQITIKIPIPHPKGWAVKTPDGDWIYLQDPREKATTLSNMFTPKEFESLTVISIQVRKLRGTVWKRNSKPSIVQVFEKPGTYLLYFADNLETEPDNTFFVQQKVYLMK